jgi:hypothetical protein
MVKNRKVIGISIVFLIILEISFAQDVNVFKNYKVNLSFKKPFWYIFFNDFWPKPQFTFVIENKGTKDDRIIEEGILVVEIAEDKGIGVLPTDEEFNFLGYALFGEIKQGQSKKLHFRLSEEFKPGRFRVKPTLFLYPKGKSPIHETYRKMRKYSEDIFRAWEWVFFKNKEWKKKLAVLGVHQIENGNYFIILRGASEVYGGITGISLLGIVLGLVYFLRKVIFKVSRNIRNET